MNRIQSSILLMFDRFRTIARSKERGSDGTIQKNPIGGCRFNCGG